MSNRPRSRSKPFLNCQCVVLSADFLIAAIQTAEHCHFSCPSALLLELGIRRDIAPGETIPSPAASLRGDLRNAPLMASHIKPWGMFQVFKALQPIFTSF